MHTRTGPSSQHHRPVPGTALPSEVVLISLGPCLARTRPGFIEEGDQMARARRRPRESPAAESSAWGSCPGWQRLPAPRTWMPKKHCVCWREAQRNRHPNRGNLVQSVALTTGQYSAPGDSRDKYMFRREEGGLTRAGRRRSTKQLAGLFHGPVSGAKPGPETMAVQCRAELDWILVQKRKPTDV